MAFSFLAFIYAGKLRMAANAAHIIFIDYCTGRFLGCCCIEIDR